MSKLIGDIEYCGNLKLPTGNISNFANIVNKTRPHTVLLTSAITITNGTFMSTVPYAKFSGGMSEMATFFSAYMDSIGGNRYAPDIIERLAYYLQGAKAVIMSDSVGKKTTIMKLDRLIYGDDYLYYTNGNNVTDNQFFGITLRYTGESLIELTISGTTDDNLSITPSDITYIDPGTQKDFTINSYGEAWDYSIDIVEHEPLYEAQKINDSTMRISVPGLSQGGVLSLTVRLNRDTSVYKTVRIVVTDDND